MRLTSDLLSKTRPLNCAVYQDYKNWIPRTKAGIVEVTTTNGDKVAVIKRMYEKVLKLGQKDQAWVETRATEDGLKIVTYGPDYKSTVVLKDINKAIAGWHKECDECELYKCKHNFKGE